jgi:hypothetical protein
MFGVPLPISRLLQPIDELQEGLVLGLELSVESFGYPLSIKGVTQAKSRAGEGQALFIVQSESDVVQLLDQRIRGAGDKPGVFTKRIRLALFSAYPLPNLSRPAGVGEDDHAAAFLGLGGSLDGWKATVRRFARRQSSLEMAVCLAFAPYVADLLGTPR